MSNAVFDGKLSDIEPIFVENLRSYVPQMLSPQYVLPKSINGCDITCQELLEYFKAYFRVFNSDDLVAPAGIFNVSGCHC